MSEITMSDAARKAKAEYAREYRKANAEKIRESRRRYRKGHIAQIAAYQRKWNREHPDAKRRYNAAYWERKAAAKAATSEDNPR